MPQVKTISLKELNKRIKKLLKENHEDTPVYIGIPSRNGIGLHYEGIVNIECYGEIVDITTTTPDSDDIKDLREY
jgi:hypothetical protein